MSRAMARAAAQVHNRDMTQHYLARAMYFGESRQSHHEIAVTRLCAAELALAHGQRDEADRSLDQATRASESMSMDWHLQKARALRRVMD